MGFGGVPKLVSTPGLPHHAAAWEELLCQFINIFLFLVMITCVIDSSLGNMFQ